MNMYCWHIVNKHGRAVFVANGFLTRNSSTFNISSFVLSHSCPSPPEKPPLLSEFQKATSGMGMNIFWNHPVSRFEGPRLHCSSWLTVNCSVWSSFSNMEQLNPRYLQNQTKNYATLTIITVTLCMARLSA